MAGETGCATAEPFALRVLGDSMEPEFKDGCIVIIDPSGVAEHGAFVIAETDNGPVFRQLIADGKQWLLKPLNPGYRADLIPNRQSIIGVVVQRAGTRRRDHKHYA